MSSQKSTQVVILISNAKVSKLISAVIFFSIYVRDFQSHVLEQLHAI